MKIIYCSVIHTVFIAVESSCSVAGWGATDPKRRFETSNSLLWAKVSIRNTTECRVKTFITFLKEDLHNLTDSNVLLVKRLDIKTPSF